MLDFPLYIHFRPIDTYSYIIFKRIYPYTSMHRNILSITEEVIDLLKKGGELSTRKISLRLKSHRSVILKSLEFLKRIGYVKETKSKDKLGARLFSLRKGNHKSI